MCLLQWDLREYGYFSGFIFEGRRVGIGLEFVINVMSSNVGKSITCQANVFSIVGVKGG